MSKTAPATCDVKSLNIIPTAPPKEIYRKDYTPPKYFVKHIDVDFKLDFVDTQVITVLHIYRNKDTPAFTDLTLHGENTINLYSVQLQLKNHLEPQKLESNKHFNISPVNHFLTIEGHLLPEESDEIFKVIVNLNVNPSTNTELTGLYKAGPILCTQCEAEGFRRLSYGLDQPDVMSTFKVRLEADKTTFPVLLSNGNQIKSGDLSDGRHFVVFEDPFPKPTYLFAIVAGNLAVKESSFTRSTGKPVRLSFWCEPKDSHKLDWAMESLKKAMKWDEERFGRIYDLEWFNIVAVSYFNFGAMENKSLNIFNTLLLMSSKETSLDEEFIRIMGVVGHEYFHNWTGNRVTCRDWFQLTLKEGLTVYRDQEFSGDLGSRSVERIKNVLIVRSHQFSEDSGPMAHSIRPESYQKIDNFYTPTVYRKGAEVIRMYETILGREGFRKGLDLYFDRHDGHAITCDDFRAAMADANGVDLTQFERWYFQAGTPVVTVDSMNYDPGTKMFTLTLSQSCPPTPNQPTKKPFHIPVTVGLIGRESKKEIVPTTLLHFTDEKQTFTLRNVTEAPILSIFRNYSAPVKVVTPISDEDYGFLMAYDTDPFNRWEAGQKLMKKVILQRAEKYRDGKEVGPVASSTLKLIVNGFKELLLDSSKSNSDRYFISYSLLLPTTQTLLSDFRPCDPVALNKARKDIRKFLGTELQPEFLAIYDLLTKLSSSRPWDLSGESIGIRSLRNIALAYLTSATQNIELALNHYYLSDNMTDRLAALTVLVDIPSNHTKEAIADFLEKANGDDLVIDKWFSIQAGADHEGVLNEVKILKHHELYNMNNPNRMGSLLGRFAANHEHFHCAEGYKFIADCIIELDKINSRAAAHEAKQLIHWKIMNSKRQELMKAELGRLAALNLSPHCDEVVTKALV